MPDLAIAVQDAGDDRVACLNHFREIHSLLRFVHLYSNLVALVLHASPCCWLLLLMGRIASDLGRFVFVVRIALIVFGSQDDDIVLLVASATGTEWLL
jgi:hypothetical protein